MAIAYIGGREQTTKGGNNMTRRKQRADTIPRIQCTGTTLRLVNRMTGDRIAEYRLTLGCEAKEIRQMRAKILQYIYDEQGTLVNYHW